MMKLIALIFATQAVFIGAMFTTTSITGNALYGVIAATVVIVIVATILQYKLNIVNYLGQKSLNFKDSRTVPALGLMIVFTFITATIVTNTIVNNTTNTVTQTDVSIVDTSVPSPTWLILLVAIVIAPIGEEALYRGVIYRVFRQWSTMPYAVFASVLIHALPQQSYEHMFTVIPISILTCIIYELTCKKYSFWIAGIAHVLYNLMTHTIDQTTFSSLFTIPVAISLFLIFAIIINNIYSRFNLSDLDKQMRDDVYSVYVNNRKTKDAKNKNTSESDTKSDDENSH